MVASCENIKELIEKISNIETRLTNLESLEFNGNHQITIQIIPIWNKIFKLFIKDKEDLIDHCFSKNLFLESPTFHLRNLTDWENLKSRTGRFEAIVKSHTNYEHSNRKIQTILKELPEIDQGPYFVIDPNFIATATPFGVIDGYSDAHYLAFFPIQLIIIFIIDSPHANKVRNSELNYFYETFEAWLIRNKEWLGINLFNGMPIELQGLIKNKDLELACCEPELWKVV